MVKVKKVQGILAQVLGSCTGQLVALAPGYLQALVTQSNREEQLIVSQVKPVIAFGVDVRLSYE